jgi:predicted transcriptional regulator
MISLAGYQAEMRRIEEDIASIGSADPLAMPTEIVASYFRHHIVGAAHVTKLIASIHRALGQLGRSSQP